MKIKKFVFAILATAALNIYASEDCSCVGTVIQIKDSDKAEWAIQMPEEALRYKNVAKTVILGRYITIVEACDSYACFTPPKRRSVRSTSTYDDKYEIYTSGNFDDAIYALKVLATGSFRGIVQLGPNYVVFWER